MFELQIYQKLALICIAGCFAGCLSQKTGFAFTLIHTFIHSSIFLLFTYVFSAKWNSGTDIAVILSNLFSQFLGGVIAFGPWIISRCVAGCYTITIVQYAICKLLPNRTASKSVNLRRSTTLSHVCVVAIYLIMSFMFLFLFRPFW